MGLLTGRPTVTLASVVLKKAAWCQVSALKLGLREMGPMKPGILQGGIDILRYPALHDYLIV